MDDDDLVCAAAFATAVDAELARTRLQSHGIDAFVVEAGSFNPLLSAALGNEVNVRERDLQRARRVLGEIVPDAAGDGEGEEVRRELVQLGKKRKKKRKAE